MISAWKRLINKGDNNHESSGSNGTDGMPPGIKKLDKELQRKFARGVNYNMKVVIKGDSRTGKSSLFLRLKGYGFEDNYVPTENLNVTSINWNYKATDDIVKIDLWEAIDAATKRSINYVDLKLENKSEPVSPDDSKQNDHFHENQQNNNVKQLPIKPTITNTNISLNGSSLNPIPESAKQSLAELSENLDVYKGAHAVLLVMDMTKSWTFKYIQNELPKIPKQISILIIANHRDQGHHRTVSPEQVKAFIEGLDRSPCDGVVMYTEASMKNGFGLKLIEKFFNIPFLRLQEASFLKQLELNRCEYLSTFEELQLMQEATNREYEQFLELQTVIRRQQADAMSPVNMGLRQLDETTREQIRNATVSSDEIDRKENVKSIESSNNQDREQPQIIASQKFVNDRLPSIVIGAKCPLPETKTYQLYKTKPTQQVLHQIKTDESVNAGEVSDDSDEEEVPRANPLVANYQDDLDSDDQINPET